MVQSKRQNFRCARFISFIRLFMALDVMIDSSDLLIGKEKPPVFMCTSNEAEG